jgi:hypothetical protein
MSAIQPVHGLNTQFTIQYQIRAALQVHLTPIFLLKKTCNYQLVVTVVMKNCEPFVSRPAFAIDKVPVHK